MPSPVETVESAPAPTAPRQPLPRWFSLRWRLPLGITALIALVLAMFLWAANRTVERTVVQSGGDRGLVAAVQLSNLLAQSTKSGLAEMQRRASDDTVRQYLTTPTDTARTAVEAYLKPLATAAQPPLVLVNRAGEPVLEIAGPIPVKPLPVLPPVTGAPGRMGVGPMRVAGDTTYADVAVAVSETDAPDDGPNPPLGYLVARRILQGQNMEAISRLVGDGAVLAVGNRTGDVWTDLIRPIPSPVAPGSAAAAGGLVTSRVSDDPSVVGGISLIDGTPWVVWIGFPRNLVLAPARATFRRMVFLAIGFACLAGVVVAGFSWRITKPLNELTIASEAIAAGEFSKRVYMPRRDELGRLGVAFNTMTDRVARAHHELEERVQQRTARLEETSALLSQQVEALERARGELDQFFGLSPDMLCIADTAARRFIRVNAAWEQALGWSQEELTSHSYEQFIHPDDLVPTSEESAKLSEGEKTLKFENRYRCKDGSYRWLSWKAAPVLSRGLVYAAARDITERRETARQLEERAVELAAVNQELEAFSYSVSHDLRAPLRHVTGFAGLLGRSAASKLDAEEQGRLKTIVDAANRMGRLIDDLLAFSRMGRGSLMKQRVPLNTLVLDAQAELAADPDCARVTWSVQPLPDIQGDPAMLRLALVNLMSNALKFTREQPKARIEIGTVGPAADETILFVRDNGVGFDMQYADKLFGVFQRLHSSDTFEGTGIGLANVRRIVHRHGGRVWAEGRVNQGATFYLSIPSRT